MEDNHIYQVPKCLNAIIADTEKLGFDMASESKTGALLQTLAASKPNARFLEIGTGTGLSTAWILAGMDQQSSLYTVDNDPQAQQIACDHLGYDQRVNFVCSNAEIWLKQNQHQQFNLIFADTWPGKFSNLDDALNMLAVGGIYIIDDLLAQPNWPEGHGSKVPALIEEIENKNQFTSVRMAWASGLMLVTRTSSIKI